MIERLLASLPEWLAALVLVGLLFVATVVLPALIEAAPWEEWPEASWPWPATTPIWRRGSSAPWTRCGPTSENRCKRHSTPARSSNIDNDDWTNW